MPSAGSVISVVLNIVGILLLIAGLYWYNQASLNKKDPDLWAYAGVVIGVLLILFSLGYLAYYSE